MASRTVLVTPRGTAQYPHLNVPDTKFNPDGQYTVKLSVPTAAAEALISKLDEAHAAAVAQAAKENPKIKKVKEAAVPYTLNPENDNETLFNFKMKARFSTQKGETITQRPAIYDAKGKPCPKGIRIGGGSVLKVSFEPIPFYTAAIGAGVTLRLKGVQVIELREYGQSAAGLGFEAEEGGFEATAIEEETTEASTDTEEADEKPEATPTTTGDGSDF